MGSSPDLEFYFQLYGSGQVLASSVLITSSVMDIRGPHLLTLKRVPSLQ